MSKNVSKDICIEMCSYLSDSHLRNVTDTEHILTKLRYCIAIDV